MLKDESWTKQGGMDEKAEVHGTGGVAYADLLQGNSIFIPYDFWKKD